MLDAMAKQQVSTLNLTLGHCQPAWTQEPYPFHLNAPRSLLPVAESHVGIVLNTYLCNCF